MALLRLVSVTDDATVMAAFRSNIQQRRPLLEEGIARSALESESAKGGALLTFWEQYPVGTSKEVLQWAKVTLHGTDCANDESDRCASSRAIGRERDREWRTDMPISQIREPDTFESVDAEVSRQLQLEETDNTPEGGHVGSAASETVTSGLGVPLEFQRLYVW